MTLKSKKTVYILSAILLVAIAFTITFQAITISNMKKTQKEHFISHIASAAQSLGEYKETGYTFMYEDALMELHSASSIALLLKEEDAYQGLHGVLLSIVGTHHSFPEDLVLFTDEIMSALNDYSTNHNTENLYTKLNNIDNKLTAMMFERAEKVE
ncbi:MAG: hypothetical protein E7473_12280 [Ruminococcaceae bacterium]|nr:hypothetical protein [Oscillospiraceae bacterium]